MNAQTEQRLYRLLEAEKAITCGEESRRSYFETHQRRFVDVLQLCRSYVPDPSARVLDIGRSELTAYLSKFYQNVHSLGLDPEIDDGGHREVTWMSAVPHITFDLLNSHDVSMWPACDPFDLIVFSEVLEHLSIAPEYVFAALGALLSDHGVLVCTTPNAAAIAKRVRLVLGRHPYDRLRLYSANPGDIRQYTGQELRAIAESVGLRCVYHGYFSWIENKAANPVKGLLKKLIRAYPPFRLFQACVLTSSGTHG